jgi:hypothetical protein
MVKRGVGRREEGGGRREELVNKKGSANSERQTDE